MSKKFKWVIIQNGWAHFFISEPKKVRGGFKVDGHSYVGTDVELLPRWVYDSANRYR